MSADADDAVIDRIRKLLALAESPNENEAAAAAEKAQALLLKHGLDAADIAAQDGGDIATERTEVYGPIPPWRRALAGVVADSVGGTCMTSRHVGARVGATIFYGPRGTTAGAAAMYEFLAERLERFANIDTATRRATWTHHATYKKDYLWGAVERMAGRLAERKARAERDHGSSSGQALVLVGSAADRAMRKDHPDLEADSHQPTVEDMGAFISGSQAAGDIPLGDPEVGRQRPELGAGGA